MILQYNVKKVTGLFLTTVKNPIWSTMFVVLMLLTNIRSKRGGTNVRQKVCSWLQTTQGFMSCICGNKHAVVKPSLFVWVLCKQEGSTDQTQEVEKTSDSVFIWKMSVSPQFMTSLHMLLSLHKVEAFLRSVRAGREDGTHFALCAGLSLFSNFLYLNHGCHL